MVSRIAALLLAGAALVQGQAAAGGNLPVDIVGTWNSKANSTMTGPNFYDPKNEKFNEPEHPGISYSFSADGHFEEAYYRAIANPGKPKCPQGIIQWQHGSWERLDNGSLVLKPIKVDGRQLWSDPCNFKHAIYTRYNASELFERYEVITDPYHKIPRLNLYKFDGSPMMPLYLAMSPPTMLPTETLNPLTTPTPATKSSKMKRGDLPLNHEALYAVPGRSRADQWWWFGVFLTASGSVLYFFF